MKEHIISEEDFTLLTQSQLLKLFTLHKNLTIEYPNKNTLSINYVSGNLVGTKFAEVILLRHLKYNPPHYTESEDDYTYTILYDKILSPLDFPRAISKLKLYHQNTLEGKKTIIPNLTESEIDHMVQELNKPLYIVTNSHSLSLQ